MNDLKKSEWNGVDIERNHRPRRIKSLYPEHIAIMAIWLLSIVLGVLAFFRI